MANNQLTTYSGKDVNFTLISPVSAAIQAAGIQSTGMFSTSVRMSVDQSTLEPGMDGSIQPSAMPGDMGTVELVVFQTSVLHKQLLALYNAIKAARDQGDVSNWFGATIVIVSIVDGTTHTCTGCAPIKVPDKAYQAQAQKVSWQFVACNIANT